MNKPMLIHNLCGCEKTDPPGRLSPQPLRKASASCLSCWDAARELYHVIAMDPNTFSKDTLAPKYAPEKS